MLWATTNTVGTWIAVPQLVQDVGEDVGRDLEPLARRILEHPRLEARAIEAGHERAELLGMARRAVHEQHGHLGRLVGLQEVDARAVALHEQRRVPQAEPAGLRGEAGVVEARDVARVPLPRQRAEVDPGEGVRPARVGPGVRPGRQRHLEPLERRPRDGPEGGRRPVPAHGLAPLEGEVLVDVHEREQAVRAGRPQERERPGAMEDPVRRRPGAPPRLVLEQDDHDWLRRRRRGRDRARDWHRHLVPDQIVPERAQVRPHAAQRTGREQQGDAHAQDPPADPRRPAPAAGRLRAPGPTFERARVRRCTCRSDGGIVARHRGPPPSAPLPRGARIS